jgi:hypothetical protein
MNSSKINEQKNKINEMHKAPDLKNNDLDLDTLTNTSKTDLELNGSSNKYISKVCFTFF